MLELVRSRPELQNAFGNWQFPLPRMPLALQLQAFAKIPGFLWPGLREAGLGLSTGWICFSVHKSLQQGQQSAGKTAEMPRK